MRYPLIAMLVTFAIFSMAHSFSTLFLNIYVWKNHSSFFYIGLFQFFSFLCTFIGIIGGAYLILYLGSRIAFIFSAIVALCLYLFLIHIQIDSSFLVVITGVLNGTYIGLFYAGFHFYSLWFSEKEQLSNIIGLQYVINSTVQLITPPLAGWVIHYKGYEATFLLGIFILFIQTIFSVTTPQIKIRKKYRRKRFFIPENRQMSYVGLSAAAFGFFYAFVHMSIGMFIYLYMKNESTIGQWNMLFTLFTIFTYFLLGRQFLQPYKETLGTLGVIISTVVTFTLIAPFPVTFIIFNVIVSISLPMMWVPAFSNQFQSVKDQVNKSNVNPLTKTMELIIFREFSLFVGRALFILILLINIFMISDTSLALLIMFLCFMPTGLFLLSKKAIN